MNNQDKNYNLRAHGRIDRQNHSLGRNQKTY